MEKYYGRSGTDLTTSSDGSGSGSWMEPSIQRMSFGSPAPNAFLGPAFNACAVSSQPGSPLGVDASLLRYTRPSRHLLSSSSSDSRDLASPTTRSQILHMLHLRSSVTSSSTSGPSRSPLSPMDNLQAPPERSPPPPYKTPVKVQLDEDVLVMDGILVMKSGSTRTKPSSEFSGSVPSSSSSSSANSHYKTEFCHSWEESGFCSYGSKCQFAHGKEDIRGVRHLKQAAKSEIGKSVQSAGSCVNGARLRHPHYAAAAKGGATRCAAGTSTTVRRPSAAAPPGGASAFVWPPSEAADKMIDDVLYGPSRRTRLPVFVEICSGLMDGP